MSSSSHAYADDHELSEIDSQIDEASSHELCPLPTHLPDNVIPFPLHKVKPSSANHCAQVIPLRVGGKRLADITVERDKPADKREDYRMVCVWACRITRALIDAFNSKRPVHHLKRWMVPQVYDYFLRRYESSYRPVGAHTRVSQLWSLHVRESVYVKDEPRYEVSAVLYDHEHVRVVCLQAVARHNKWLIEALEFI